MVLLVIAVILALLIMLTAVGTALYYYFKESEEVLTDYQVVLNIYAPRYTKGFAFLTCLEIIHGVERVGLKLIPKDVARLNYYDKDKKKYIIPENITEPFVLWLPAENYEFISKGVSSNNKNIIKIIPLSVYDISPQLKNTQSGKALMHTIENINIERNTEDFVTNEMEKQRKIINNDFFGELSGDAIERLQTIHNDSIALASKESSKNPTYSFKTHGHGGGGS